MFLRQSTDGQCGPGCLLLPKPPGISRSRINFTHGWQRHLSQPQGSGSRQDCRTEGLLLGIHTLTWSSGVKVAGRRAAFHPLQKIVASGYWLLQGSKSSSYTVATISHQGLSLFYAPSSHQWTFAEMNSSSQNSARENPFIIFGH